MPKIEFFKEDCMGVMRRYPDKHFNLAIVDPPYGVGISANPVRQQHNKKSWDSSAPAKTYFDELIRVSKNQIIWGGNYFDLPPSQGFIIWDKRQPEKFSLAMCELAWTSIQSPAKIYRYSVLTERDKIHPTQKPVALYKWLLKNYAKPGDTILDTHGGSMSSAIACHEMGFDLTICEIDEEYFDKGVERFHLVTSQQKLFA